MKVRVTMTLDVNPEAWIAEYGTTEADVRADVVEHVTSMVHVYFGDRRLLNGPEWVDGLR